MGATVTVHYRTSVDRVVPNVEELMVWCLVERCDVVFAVDVAEAVVIRRGLLYARQ